MTLESFYLRPHHWLAIYLAVAVLMVYRPPKALQGIGGFITAHFGDSIGLYLLHLGIALVVFGGFYNAEQAVIQIGNSLIMTAIGVLKLTKDSSQPAPPTNLKAQEPPKQ